MLLYRFYVYYVLVFLTENLNIRHFFVKINKRCIIIEFVKQFQVVEAKFRKRRDYTARKPIRVEISNYKHRDIRSRTFLHNNNANRVW